MKLAYTVKEAAESTGYSRDVIDRAIRAGDMATLDPKVEGRSIKVRTIRSTELERWLEDRQRK